MPMAIGNRRFGVALAIHHISDLSMYGIKALGREMSTVPTILLGVSGIISTFSFFFIISIPRIHSVLRCGILVHGLLVCLSVCVWAQP